MLPVICILCHLLSIPDTNCGDSQTAVPELVCSSPGVIAANQRLRWEENDRFKLHPSLSTGGAHESVTSRRFSPSRGSLQIDTDSTPLTSETPTRASPIKSLLWFPPLIINASKLSRAVIGMELFSTRTHLREEPICLPPRFQLPLFFHFLPWKRPCPCIIFIRTHCSVWFHVVSASCLCWWLPHRHKWKAVKAPLWKLKLAHWISAGNLKRCLSLHCWGGCWEARDGFPGKKKKNVLLQTPSVPFDFHTNIDQVPPGLQGLFIKDTKASLLPWLQITGFINTVDLNKGLHTGAWILLMAAAHNFSSLEKNNWRDNHWRLNGV